MQNLLVKYPTLVRHIFQENASLKAVPEFAKCTAREMCFVVLVADFFSPLRYLCFDEFGEEIDNGERIQRKEAARFAGYCYKRSVSRGLTEVGRRYVNGVKHVEEAIITYRKIQGFDELGMLFNLKKTYMKYSSQQLHEVKDMSKHVKNSLDIIKDNGGLANVNESIKTHIARLPKFSELTQKEVEENSEDVGELDPDA